VRTVVLIALASCTSCVSVAWERHLAFEPVRTADVQALRVGESDIADALERLGAPLYVWEGVNQAIVLAYGHQKSREWGVRVSVPLDQASASASYDDVAQKIEGWVLVFGNDDKLKVLREGYLRDLRSEGRRPPAPVE
jgi:hypothetical protein